MEHEDRHAQSLLKRANLIHMQTLVVDQTPKRLPFLWGETYMHVPICMVPRVLWPDKPHGHISTELLGLRYGVTNRHQARTTTIGFGLLAEAWANFGWGGVIGLALLIGSGMRVISRACANAHPSSLHMLLSVVWIAEFSDRTSHEFLGLVVLPGSGCHPGYSLSVYRFTTRSNGNKPGPRLCILTVTREWPCRNHARSLFWRAS